MVYKTCRAMATRFELWLAGADEEHLEAVGQQALQEVRRVERLLSRYDPAAELARLNREAAHQPVRVGVELLGLLLDARDRYTQTGGYFDVAVAGEVGWAAVSVDPARRLVHFTAPGVTLDFGGYGKGYALDRVGRLLERYGVANALLHGGTSSVWACGHRPDGSAWPIRVEPPFAGADPILWSLSGGGFSCSGVFTTGDTELVNPITHTPVQEPGVCAVFAPTALAAEVWSTAVVAMGPDVARDRLRADPAAEALRVAWIQPTEAGSSCQWLNPTNIPV